MKNKEALIVVDYQNDFAHPKWSLYVPGWEKLVDYINSVMKEVKSKSGIIITSQDWHPKNHVSFASTFSLPDFSLIENEVKWPDHCVAQSWWAEFLKWFEYNKVDRKVFKWITKDSDSYSSFGWIEPETNLNLNAILTSYNIEIIKIVWLATEYCDIATVIDGLKLWYQVEVLTNWIAAVNVNPNDGANAIEKMSRYWAKII